VRAADISGGSNWLSVDHRLSSSFWGRRSNRRIRASRGDGLQDFCVYHQAFSKAKLLTYKQKSEYHDLFSPQTKIDKNQIFR
jgi:hypothetical protein